MITLYKARTYNSEDGYRQEVRVPNTFFIRSNIEYEQSDFIYSKIDGSIIDWHKYYLNPKDINVPTIDEWLSQPNHRIEYVYYTEEDEDNPSGNTDNIKFIKYLKFGSPSGYPSNDVPDGEWYFSVWTVKLEYDAKDNVVKNTVILGKPGDFEFYPNIGE